MATDIARWAKHIEDPTGYPDHPTMLQHWTWTGATTTGKRLEYRVFRTRVRQYVPHESYTERGKARGRRAHSEHPIYEWHEKRLPTPRVLLDGKQVSPARVLWLRHFKPPPALKIRLKNFCGDRRCINPLHWREIEKPEAQ